MALLDVNKISRYRKTLAESFLIYPFSVLDAKSGLWQKRKKMWKELGIKSELGREATTFNIGGWVNKKSYDSRIHIHVPETSVFDPVLCEIMYRWFCPEGGFIVDPFAGGSVRGVVASVLGFEYLGIDLSAPQIEENRKQAKELCKEPLPQWAEGDASDVLCCLDNGADFIFTCPPYYDLEKYSENPRDLSNMSEEEFNKKYVGIIKEACFLLKSDRFACFVVSNTRRKDGSMRNLVGLTVEAFEQAGVRFYNDMILEGIIATAAVRANSQFAKGKKVVKLHQNVLVFKKP